MPPWLAEIFIRGSLLVLILILAGIAFLLWFKTGILERMPGPLEFHPVKAEELTELSHEELERMTTEFESLGFLWEVDYVPRSKVTRGTSAFGRLFTHPRHFCYGEIQQIITSSGKVTPVQFNLMSLLEDDWTLSSGNRAPRSIKMIWLWRQPKVLWTTHPNISPEKVLAAHLELRDRIAGDLGLRVPTILSAEAYFAHEQQAAIRRKEALRRKNILIGWIELWCFEKNPRSQWLGDYPRLARKT
jgi:hypothetical protein